LPLEEHSTDDTPSVHAPKGLPVSSDATPHRRLRLHRDFPSAYLPDKRDLIVYVPPGYGRHPDRTYPVLYINDGQNLFDPRTSFIPGQTWEVREHADEAIRAGEVEPLIIVGIYNTPVRLAEYTHERDWQRGGGDADKYGLTLTREILPFIATQYRVQTDRDSTGLGGSSLGGLVTLYLGLRSNSASWPYSHPASGGTTRASSATSTSAHRKSGTGRACGSTSATKKAAAPCRMWRP